MSTDYPFNAGTAKMAARVLSPLGATLDALHQAIIDDPTFRRQVADKVAVVPDIAWPSSLSLYAQCRLGRAVLGLHYVQSDQMEPAELAEMRQIGTGYLPQEDAETLQKFMELLPSLVEVLNDRERSILILRFGLNGQTRLILKDVGARFHLSGERVRSIEAKALSRLRGGYAKALREEQVALEPSSIYDQPIQSLGLQTRTENCLRKAKIRTIGELVKWSPEDLTGKVARFGDATLRDVQDRLLAIGLTLS